MAIRDYKESDLDTVKALVRSDNALGMDMVAYELSKGTRLVYDDGVIKGCAIVAQAGRPGQVTVRVLVDPSCRGQGIGRMLWDAIQPLVEAPEVTMVVTFYRGDRGHSREFFYPRGFKRWFGSHLMFYRGQRLPETHLEARPFDDTLFGEYVRLINEGFAPMREQNDIKPYRIYTDDATEDQELRKKTAQQHRENSWFFYDHGQLVGWAELDGAEIDTIAVAPEHQRQGYGRQIMHYCTNYLLDKGVDPVQLHVVETNAHVKRFYESIGFELIETYEYARRVR